MCVLVYPDGGYRVEKSFQGKGVPKFEVTVYVGTLSDEDMKELHATISNPKFAQIQTAAPADYRGQVSDHITKHEDVNTLAITVPREHSVQKMTFMSASERKPFQPNLAPFVDWMKQLENRKLEPAKSEKPDNCKAPTSAGATP
jgi:hypothetical protein